MAGGREGEFLQVHAQVLRPIVAHQGRIRGVAQRRGDDLAGDGRPRGAGVAGFQIIEIGAVIEAGAAAAVVRVQVEGGGDAVRLTLAGGELVIAFLQVSEQARGRPSAAVGGGLPVEGALALDVERMKEEEAAGFREVPGLGVGVVGGLDQFPLGDVVGAARAVQVGGAGGAVGRGEDEEVAGGIDRERGVPERAFWEIPKNVPFLSRSVCGARSGSGTSATAGRTTPITRSTATCGGTTSPSSPSTGDSSFRSSLTSGEKTFG